MWLPAGCRSRLLLGDQFAALEVAGIASATQQPGLLGEPEVVLALACIRRLNDDQDTLARGRSVRHGDTLSIRIHTAPTAVRRSADTVWSVDVRIGVTQAPREISVVGGDALRDGLKS